MTVSQALYDISYVNAIMYSKTIPSIGSKTEANDQPLYDDSLDANDVTKFNDFENEQIVKA